MYNPKVVGNVDVGSTVRVYYTTIVSGELKATRIVKIEKIEMTGTHIFLIALLLLVPVAVYGQTLPVKVRTYLKSNYPGWKQTAVANLCYSTFGRSFVAGDFDGDRKRDYAVKFTHRKKGYIIAFLERRTDYETNVLASDSARGIKNTGLNIARKGAKYPIGGDYPDLVYGRLRNDAPMIGPCASHAGHYGYRNGRFQ